MKKIILLTTLLISSFAIAQGPSSSEVFSKIDTNGDGQLTETEMKTAKENKPQKSERPQKQKSGEGKSPMTRFDKDGNGTLSYSEFEAMHEARKERRQKKN